MTSKQLAKDMKPFNKRMKKASKHLNKYITDLGLMIRIMSHPTEEYFWLSGKCGIKHFEFDFIKIDKTRFKVKVFKLWFGAIVEMKEVKEP